MGRNEKPALLLLRLSSTPSWRRKAFAFLPAAVILPYLIHTVWRDLPGMASFAVAPDIPMATVSMLLLVAHLAGTGLGCWMFLRALGTPISAVQSMRITILSLMGKYLPGKVWVILGKVYLAGRLGVPKRLALTATAYEVALANLSGITLFLLTAGHRSLVPGIDWALPAVALTLAGAILAPNTLSWFLNGLLHFAGRERIDRSLSRHHILAGLILYAGGWLLATYSFHLFLAAFSLDIGFGQTLCAFTASYVAGFLVLVAPGGLGVREGVMAYLLINLGLPAAEAATAALACRVWSTGGELLCLAPALLSGIARSEAILGEPARPEED